MDCLIKTIEMEEIYKYICEISIKLSIKKENLIKLWCEEQKIYESVFDEYLALKICFMHFLSQNAISK